MNLKRDHRKSWRELSWIGRVKSGVNGPTQSKRTLSEVDPSTIPKFSLKKRTSIFEMLYNNRKD